jgi:sigma-B regulation protein RsbU (phosphoserine phosphatase)
LTACNRALAPRLLHSSMQTGFLTVLLDPRGRKAMVANAGMITPLLWRAGRVSYIDSYGLPLGADADKVYTQQTVALQPGDQLLLVSDGIVEAMNSAREMWDFERLEEIVARCGGEHPSVVVDVILGEVHRFTAGAPPHDDMTVVALQLV